MFPGRMLQQQQSDVNPADAVCKILRCKLRPCWIPIGQLSDKPLQPAAGPFNRHGGGLDVPVGCIEERSRACLDLSEECLQGLSIALLDRPKDVQGQDVGGAFPYGQDLLSEALMHMIAFVLITVS